MGAAAAACEAATTPTQDKCEFFQSQVNFLGHVISAGGVAVQQHKVDAVKQCPRRRACRTCAASWV